MPRAAGSASPSQYRRLSVTAADAESGPLPARGAETPSISRLVSFSDAVFAIAITLLALQLRVPTIKDSHSARELSHALADVDGQFFTYGITFTLIGLYWLAHHRIFQYIVGHDRRLAELNLLFLFTISFLPFPADLLGHYPSNRTAVIVYAGNLAAVSAASATLWVYATRAHLTDPSLSPRLARYFVLRPIVTGAVFLASIGVAFLSADAGARLWLLAFPALLLVRRLYPENRD
jgi:uncharacterized membrane protein